MPQARYDAVADFYEAGWPDAYDDSVSSALFELLGPVRGERIVDVACGHGRISRELARRGATVEALDLSGALIEKAIAAERQVPLGVRYRQVDITVGLLADEHAFDAVVCSFGLSDIDDLDRAVASISSALRPGGRFVFSILHPCFPGGAEVSGSWPTTGSYHDEVWWQADGGASSLRGQVGANHRLLSTYVNTLRRYDLWLDAMREPDPPADWRHSNADAARYPVFLVARCAHLSR